jgi:hypothetical protein
MVGLYFVPPTIGLVTPGVTIALPSTTLFLLFPLSIKTS